ncbi:MAG: HAD-IIA family hydrolase [Planctomycetota bacterium]|jgi:phosphoglycolate/pyridoxal phosphate phosphatase family enzyme
MTDIAHSPAAGAAEIRALVEAARGFIFDLDGTLYVGEHLIPGADRALAELRAAGKKVAFVSNKPIGTRQEYAAKLNRLGIPCSVEEVINSPLVLARYLQKRRPGARCFPVAEEPVIRELLAHGLKLSEDPEHIDVVVVAFDRTFDYAKLNTAYRASLHGAELIATNPDRTCPMPDYDLPDAACMIAAIEACTGRRVEPIVGKPSEIMLREALDIIQLRPHECAMVGDRPETDMVMARRAGLAAVLVLTGVTSAEDLPSLTVAPDYVLGSVAEMADACAPRQPPPATGEDHE